MKSSKHYCWEPNWKWVCELNSKHVCCSLTSALKIELRTTVGQMHHDKDWQRTVKADNGKGQILRLDWHAATLAMVAPARMTSTRRQQRIYLSMNYCVNEICKMHLGCHISWRSYGTTIALAATWTWTMSQILSASARHQDWFVAGSLTLTWCCSCCCHHTDAVIALNQLNWIEQEHRLDWTIVCGPCNLTTIELVARTICHHQLVLLQLQWCMSLSLQLAARPSLVRWLLHVPHSI